MIPRAIKPLSDRARLRRDYAMFDQRWRSEVLGALDHAPLAHPGQLPMFEDLPATAGVQTETPQPCGRQHELFGGA